MDHNWGCILIILYYFITSRFLWFQSINKYINCIHILWWKEYFLKFMCNLLCIKNSSTCTEHAIVYIYYFCIQYLSSPAVRRFDMLWLLYAMCMMRSYTIPFSTCKYLYIAGQTFMLNGGNIKWGKGKILQRALVRVIYTSEKLHDVYDSYSRIIYSVWPWQDEFHEIYFSSFSWGDRRHHEV